MAVYILDHTYKILCHHDHMVELNPMFGLHVYMYMHAHSFQILCAATAPPPNPIPPHPGQGCSITCSFSRICSIIFMAPRRRCSFRVFSISSSTLILRTRSTSIIWSRRRSSTSISSRICRFSRIWASRIAWHFALRISCRERKTCKVSWDIFSYVKIDNCIMICWNCMWHMHINMCLNTYQYFKLSSILF